MKIRPYQPQDRAAVREICYLTGFAGESISFAWRDQKSFADMFSGYYTDREPDSLIIAEEDGRVVGYLLGCRDSRDAWSPVAVAVRHVFTRGIAFRPGTAPYIWRALVDAVRDRVQSGVRPSDLEFHDARYPAHLHINLCEAARGSGAGGALIETWFAQLRSLGITGCHLQTLHENTNAISFFSKMGFSRFGEPVLVPGERTPQGDRVHVVTMVRSLQTVVTETPS